MSTADGDLPTPDYSEVSDPAQVADPTLQMPVMLKFDDWRSNSFTTATESAAPVQDTTPRPSHSDTDDGFPEPPPDYDLQDDRVYEGLIPPHKLPNPVQESRDHKRLHQEIKFLAKRGANPLEQKPELQREMERRKVGKQKKDLLEQQKKNRTSFEQKLDQQYDKLKAAENTEKQSTEKERKKSELERMQNKILSKNSQAATEVDAST